ncbi:MAG: hypothetical protein UH851_03185, partial [Clostridia bacterium]|nr:hypothetical protein [Clostridia bacterium]
FALNAFNITDIDVFFDGWWTLFIIIPCAIGLFTEREKIGGTALPKLPRPVLAETLNACLKLFPSDALVLIRDEKVAHSKRDVSTNIQ